LLVATLDIPGHLRQVRAARTFAALVLEAHDQPDDGIAGLLVSELVTNSLLHSASGRPGGMLTVAVAITRHQLVVEVTDDGGPTDPAISSDGDLDTDAEGGRGLRLVRELSADWGFYRQGHRLTTWFDLPAKGPGAMTSHECECGYQADSATDLSDHLGEVFITDDDIAPDDRPHAERGDGAGAVWRCLCGFAADTAGGLDDHLLQAFIPDDRIGRDGAKHSGPAVREGCEMRMDR
jgi:anti-sigma regulatory factor (Ser/Thr protein kinase)